MISEAPTNPYNNVVDLRRVGEPTPAGDLRFDRDAKWRAAGERTIVKGDADGTVSGFDVMLQNNESGNFQTVTCYAPS